MGYRKARLQSGAGHYACNIARKYPATMIFVPSRDGLSHNEAEYTSPEDCTAGANVLLHSVLAFAEPN
ncbi:M20/M25/M40 family metallo-hydrolase [Vibrio parahaemolyticus]